METKLTALEWYHAKLAEPTTQAKDVNTIFLLAKGMEKQQIIDSFGVGCHYESKRLVGYHDVAEQYYNETYGN